MERTLVIYTYNIWNSNCFSFFEKVYPDQDVDWMCIQNKNFQDITYAEFENTNIPDNVLIFQRKNIGHDFGAWTFGLSQINIESYKYFVFINSSVRGPILPVYIKTGWVNFFTNMITNDVKLVGPTINCSGVRGFYPHHESHVQSYAFCTDFIGLNLLLSGGIFSDENLDRKQIIIRKEILMSRIIINNGYNIACFMHILKGIDFRRLNEFDISRMPQENPQQNKYLENYTINPSEVLFLKTGWDIRRRYFHLNSPFSTQRIKDIKQKYSAWRENIEFLAYLFSRFDFEKASADNQNCIDMLYCFSDFSRKVKNSIYRFKLFLFDEEFVIENVSNPSICILNMKGKNKEYLSKINMSKISTNTISILCYNNLVIETIMEDWFKKVNYSSNNPISAYYDIGIENL